MSRLFFQNRRFSCAVIKLGNVTTVVQKLSSRELVPINYLPKHMDQVFLQHLQWMVKKDNLGQDIFLFGHPSAYRRRLAMSFCELTHREVEYVSISRDTTEADLKQRREIINNSAIYVNQSALRAALHGRVLVIEGVEKAERNVLPILNNLLENREMQLEDGRFLMCSSTYDKLVSQHSVDQMKKWRFLRCSEKMRVVALGLPGHPLDPPLRSRFQVRFIAGESYEELLGRLCRDYQQVGTERLKRLVSVMVALRGGDLLEEVRLPQFPLDNVDAAVSLLAREPRTTDKQLLRSLWPYTTISEPRSITAVEHLLRHCGIDLSASPHLRKLPIDIRNRIPPCFLCSAVTDHMLSELIESVNAGGALCVIGSPGSGRSSLVAALATVLGTRTIPVVLYADMTPRDLVQRRETDPDSGDTVWRHSTLVRAALNGRWAVLQGLHRLEKGCLAVLGQLASDGEVHLFDGGRLLRSDRWEAVRHEGGCDKAQMAARGILKVHPDFRMIAIADPPSSSSQTGKESRGSGWLTAEVVAAFRFHEVQAPSSKEQWDIVRHKVPAVPSDKLNRLLEISHSIRDSPDSQVRLLAPSLSLRQCLRISRLLASHPDEDLVAAIHRACLSKFLPRHIRASLDDLLQPFITPPLTKSSTTLSDSEQLAALVSDYHKSKPPSEPLTGEEEAKIPQVLFYDSVAHTRILLEMMRDFLLPGEPQHLLLVGNQGVGKNKIADRFLELLRLPREYLQLHRDTTVQSLTVQPTMRDGRLVYEDSVLVRAARLGRVLVLDEADKASTEVTCVLRELLGGGAVALGDGRRLEASQTTDNGQEDVVRVSPAFRAIVLANRPGFPFLGNDFFGSMGDVFSCHAVDNPDATSEVAMLNRYAPSVSMETTTTLVRLFSDLRSLADQGQAHYPYSTRELVNIVRHLEKFPDDALSSVLGNVFDFDLASKEAMSTIEATLEKHGISLPGTSVKVAFARESPLPAGVRGSSWLLRGPVTTLNYSAYKGSIKSLGPVSSSTHRPETQITRSRAFSELEEVVSLRLGEYNIVCDLLVAGDRTVHLATLNPIEVHTLLLPEDGRLSSCLEATKTDLSPLFPAVQGSFRPAVHLAASADPTIVFLHETSTNILLRVDTSTGGADRIICEECLPESRFRLRPRWYGTDSSSDNSRNLISMYRNWSLHPSDPFIVFHKSGDDFLSVYNPLDNEWCRLDVRVALKTVHLVDRHSWLAQDNHNMFYLISRITSPERKFTLQKIYSEEKSLTIERLFNTTFDASCAGLDKSSSQPIPGTSSTSYADFLPLSTLSDKAPSFLTTTPRPSPLSQSTLFLPASSVALPAPSMIVSVVDKSAVPKKSLVSTAVPATSTPGFLEVVNLKNRSVKYLHVPSPFSDPVSYKWLSVGVPSVFVAALGHGVISLDHTGCLHKWTLCPQRLSEDLQAWKRGIGAGGDAGRDLMIERLEGGLDTTLGGPKHGKVDPSGAPHVGGNTWAGGSGGRDTAGLGGIGGPYRLDGGHDVYQVPDSIKAAVPEHVKVAAREVAKKAWKDRLREIEMSEMDFELYQKYYQRVQAQVAAMRVIVDGLKATAKERQWIRHKTYGDLDDGKLVEGVLGERTIYRARGEKDPEPGAPQLKPKRLRVVADVSGSMYRFNGQDRRMERQLEALLMLMESFSGVDKQKMVYDICGHSGEGPQFPFVKLHEPPQNEKQRMDVLMAVLAHSQFCISGDHTLEAIEAGLSDLRATVDDMDQSFLVVLSDANLSRYGIPPSSVARLLLREKEVQSYVVFIGSLGEQAQQLKRALPVGRSFVCMDTGALPGVLKDIFTSTVLQ